MSDEHTSVLFRVRTPGLSRRSVRSYALVLEQEVAEGKAFCCLIAGDRELRRLNREFRQEDHATDVLSFPSDGKRSGAIGDIAISFRRAKEQAAEHGHGVEQEIEILMLHGLLHLLGLDHETDRGRMARIERNWRESLGLPTGVIERARS